jgi:class 3 adenylate cyclase
VFAAHQGRVLDTEGDAFFAVFTRAVDATRAAIEVQQALVGGPVQVRIGIHTTEPHLHPEGYVGVGVSRAARICSAGHGGQILLSSVTAGVIQDRDEPGLRLKDLGEHRLKDIPRPERLFQVDADDLPVEFPRLRAAPTAGSIGTLLALDMVGFGKIIREQGDDAAADIAAEYHAVIEQRVRAAGGDQAERVADHALCLFPDPLPALVAAAGIRAELSGRGFIVQAGIHTGRLARPADGLYGSAAIRVMRLCWECEPGQVLLSAATASMLEGAILTGLALRDLGERQFPGADEPPTRVYELLDDP